MPVLKSTPALKESAKEAVELSRVEVPSVSSSDLDASAYGRFGMGIDSRTAFGQLLNLVIDVAVVTAILMRLAGFPEIDATPNPGPAS